MAYAQRRNKRQLTNDAITAAAAASIGISGVLSPNVVDSGPIVCPFRLITGLPCPGCGSIRAWTSALEGDFSSALQFNPFSVLVLVLAVGLVAWRLMAWLVPDISKPDPLSLLAKPITLSFVGVWCVWALLRAVGGL